MADKKKSGHSYLNDFQRNVAGDYIYAGDMYECGASREEIKQQKLFLGILTFLLSAAVIAGGCINAPGLHNVFYLIIPLLCIASGILLQVITVRKKKKAKSAPSVKES